MLGLAVDLLRNKNSHNNPAELLASIDDKLTFIQTARPTAVNISTVSMNLQRDLSQLTEKSSCEEIIECVTTFAVRLLNEDLQQNRRIGDYGAQWLKAKTKMASVKVLTHCNTGSLATSGYGTALGIIRRLHEIGMLEQIYCTETRPYNQGSRLTAYELVMDCLPRPTLICDSMASALLSIQKTKGTSLAAIIVGADRIASNGDTANKIGTYQLAITAKYHGVFFIVAAPWDTIDLKLTHGGLIPIEERSSKEMTQIYGKVVSKSDTREYQMVETAVEGISVWNPAFDITPAALIDCIVTERGVYEKKPGSLEFDLMGSSSEGKLTNN